MKEDFTAGSCKPMPKEQTKAMEKDAVQWWREAEEMFDCSQIKQEDTELLRCSW